MSAAGVVLIGTPEDARGFRLAGVAGCACVDRQDVERALAAWSATGATMPALVLVSAPVHAL
ncbi:MAG TPA: hypothetical protein VIG50_19535, partial [Vicinamibacteria bacterium]